MNKHYDKLSNGLNKRLTQYSIKWTTCGFSSRVGLKWDPMGAMKPPLQGVTTSLWALHVISTTVTAFWTASFQQHRAEKHPWFNKNTKWWSAENGKVLIFDTSRLQFIAFAKNSIFTLRKITVNLKHSTQTTKAAKAYMNEVRHYISLLSFRFRIF